VESRSRAQAVIMAGLVFTGESRVQKPGHMLAVDAPLVLRGQDHPWVSRGGLKLAQALEAFDLDPTGAVCIDVGASTGGFTDVLLAHGAVQVFAVDVGRGQLAWKLRQDNRVVVLEQTNARHLSDHEITSPADWVVCDASFIGLRTVLPAALALTRDTAVLVALIKPQFEVGRDQVGKKGVVRDPALHQAVCDEMRQWIEAQPHWQVTGITPSPITGPEGNREFLLVAHKQASNK
ncbi:MAG: TlyA family RNA methyltransferase, partial [Pseudomonadota bacterium]